MSPFKIPEIKPEEKVDVKDDEQPNFQLNGDNLFKI